MGSASERGLMKKGKHPSPFSISLTPKKLQKMDLCKAD